MVQPSDTSHLVLVHLNIWQTSAENGIKALQAKNRINIILPQPSLAARVTVRVKGEVEFPENIRFARGETLGDLMERVGYLTK